ncbi:hypothetical protein M427DRAFT_161572 [Gonapodya prolifera JEL478]|uniref:Uncharacterized protein n=1 Tax=Gonapodya prolifera (strain JEL478) TaxID=1344416 RepID=A0A139AZ73_GONPJ|nr:hypothetical protein M427DRAFT_161572 [Gonapodya prolifera JEL478]|eukprot:KXS22000.1 hypothetical protein M427DRAFT_161572 [Gonapodya prolifera JEL478]
MGMTLELLSYDFVFLDEVFAPDLHPTKTGTALTEIWMLAKGYGEHSGGTAACWRSIPTRNKLSAHSSETTARIQAILVGISQHPHSFMPEILGICLFWSRLVWGCVVPAVLNVLVRMDLVSAREELKLHGARETVLRVANKLESAITEELPGWQTARLAAGYSILASALGVQPNL